MFSLGYWGQAAGLRDPANRNSSYGLEYCTRCQLRKSSENCSQVGLADSRYQVSNFFVTFITPILLARSSSAIYFLFGGATAIGVAVSTIYMPETKGQDLETIGEAFGIRSARDLPAILDLKQWASRVRRILGFNRVRRSDGATSSGSGIELQSRS